MVPLRLTQAPVQVDSGDTVGVTTPDATAAAYGPLTHLVGGGVGAGC